MRENDRAATIMNYRHKIELCPHQEGGYKDDTDFFDEKVSWTQTDESLTGNIRRVLMLSLKVMGRVSCLRKMDALRRDDMGTGSKTHAELPNKTDKGTSLNS